MEVLTGRFTRERRVSNFINSASWKICKKGNLYTWYDGHRLDFHTNTRNKEIRIELDKEAYLTYTNKTLEEAKLAIINHLIDEGVYPIRVEKE